jgi:arylsulfatase A-like enzyme
MPFMVRMPSIVRPGSVCNDIITNVDFAPTWLELAGIPKPTYYQGYSFLDSLDGTRSPLKAQQVAYHRYWMHRDVIHDAYAHYGIRDHRHKLIFWYNESFQLEGTTHGGEEQEWELFDCERDPLELFNCWNEEGYHDVREKMVRLLESKMAEIGDVPEHPLGVPAETLAQIYSTSYGLASIAQEKNI